MWLTAGYTLEKISEWEDIQIEAIWNSGQKFSKFDEKYKSTHLRVSTQLTQYKYKEKEKQIKVPRITIAEHWK